MTFAGVASAIPIYEYNDDKPHLGENLKREQLFNINSTYDADSAQFSWEFTITDKKVAGRNCGIRFGYFDRAFIISCTYRRTPES